MENSQCAHRVLVGPVGKSDIKSYVEALFKYANSPVYVTHRAYTEGRSSQCINRTATCIGGGDLVADAVAAATTAAKYPIPTVYCPPIAGFSTATEATESALVEAYTISVDCDQHPYESRRLLESNLGQATVVVATGGEWHDPDTNQVEDKLHLHWRLTKAAVGEDLVRLKTARKMATDKVGGDFTGVSPVHPFRAPGSWHRKAEPRLAKIITLNETAEIELGHALDRLGQMNPARWVAGIAPVSAYAHQHLAYDSPSPREQDLARALEGFWDPDNYSDWTNAALALHGVPGGQEAWLRWSARSAKFDMSENNHKWSQTVPTRGITALSIFARVPKETLSAWGRDNTARGRFNVSDLGIFQPRNPGHPPAAGQHSYKLDPHGRPKAELGNVVAALCDQSLSGADICFDTFRAELMTSQPGQNAWRPLLDGDAVELRIRLSNHGFPPVGREVMRDALTLVARDKQVDSAMQWLRHGVPRWDGIPRVETALSDHFRVRDEPYTRAVAQYLFTAMAGRVLSPGCQADMVVILVGGQGVGKSTAAAALSPHTDLFGELSFSEKDADQSRAIRGKLILELSELRGLKTRDAESIKGLITRRHERWTPKYKEYETSYPRRCIFVGTTNSAEFLADETGERRWLPVRVEGQIDINALKAAMPQLWAEARELFGRHGVIWQKAQALAASLHAGFKDRDPWTDNVIEWLENGGHIGLAPPTAMTTLEILRDALGFEVRQVGQREKQRLSKIMRENGFTLKSIWKGGRSNWAWVLDRGPLTPSHESEEVTG